MKNLLLLFCFVVFAMFGKAQVNLVQNPSFEDTIHCPSASGDINKASGWSGYLGTPDYFNTCAPPFPYSPVSVPNNFGGYQQPASGNAYAGYATFVFPNPTFVEFIGGQLLTPLSIGTKYFASFKVALSISTYGSTNYATNNMGINFSTVPYIAGTNNAPITNTAKVYSTSIITDTLNWTSIFGSFIADSTYGYVMLGNFFDDAHTDTMRFFSAAQAIGYYYLDDICVSTDSLFALDYVWTGIKENTYQIDVSVYPNPASEEFTIKSDIPIQKVEVYNMTGQMVLQRELKKQEAAIDVSHFTNGIYLINIQYNNTTINKKIIINH